MAALQVTDGDINLALFIVETTLHSLQIKLKIHTLVLSSLLDILDIAPVACNAATSCDVQGQQASSNVWGD